MATWPFHKHARPDCQSTCHHSHIMVEIAPITFVCYPPSNLHLNQRIEWHAFYCKKMYKLYKNVTNKPGQFFGKIIPKTHVNLWSAKAAYDFAKFPRIPIARDNVLRFHDVTCFFPLQHQNRLNNRHQPKTLLNPHPSATLFFSSLNLFEHRSRHLRQGGVVGTGHVWSCWRPPRDVKARLDGTF